MTTPARPAKVSARAIAALAFAAVCVYAADQGVKAFVVTHLTYGRTVDVLGSLLQVHYVTNPGAAFSFAVNMTWVFSVIAAAVVVAIVVLARRIRSLWWAVLFGMLLGGALGNLTDRLIRPPSFGRGQVVDFIYTPWMMPAIYNIADSFICISMAIFVILTLFGVNLDGTRAPSKRAQAAAATSAARTDAADHDGSAAVAVDRVAQEGRGTTATSAPDPQVGRAGAGGAGAERTGADGGATGRAGADGAAAERAGADRAVGHDAT